MRRVLTPAILALSGVACGSLAAADESAVAVVAASIPGTTIVATTTSSTTSTTTVPLPTREDARALVTPTGVVVPVRSVNESDWTAASPCGNEVTVADASFVAEVDVVIDPGHGGAQEPGAAGSTGLAEATANLEVALRVEAWLAERGISSILTRYADYRLPIVTRAEIATAVDPAAFVSIHHNGGSGLASWSEPATEIYVQHEDPEALRLGELLYEELLAGLSGFDAAWQGSGNAGVRFRLDGDGTDFYGVLRRSVGVPAVITEALFLTNPAEEALLLDPAGLDAEAEAIGVAIQRFLETDETGYGFAGTDTITSSGSGTGGTAGCVDPALS